MLAIIEDTLADSLLLLPFLFLTYLAMEYLEHRTGNRVKERIESAGKWGPFWGGLLGAVPQCGFSAAASSLYAGRVITVGTLIAIYLSTSDEMLPVLITAQAPPKLIAWILALKVLVGMAAGFVIDLIFRDKRQGGHEIHELCEKEHCHCEKGIWRSAASHSLKIFFFIVLVTFALNLVLEYVGEEALGWLWLKGAVAGPLLSGLVGLIPNCAASVVITELYLEGAMSFGTMMSGLLVGSGMGVLVLFRTNHNKKENFLIIATLYAVGVLVGIVL